MPDEKPVSKDPIYVYVDPSLLKEIDQEVFEQRQGGDKRFSRTEWYDQAARFYLEHKNKTQVGQ